MHLRKLWRRFCILAALEGGVAIAVLVAIPREDSSLSFARAAMVAFLAIFVLLGLVWALRPPVLAADSISAHVIAVLAGLSFAAAVTLFLLRFLDPPTLLAYYKRLGVVLWFIFALSLQALLLVLTVRHGLRRSAISDLRDLRWPAATAFAILLCVMLIVKITGLGITPDPAYWAEPGVPILGWQLALGVVAGLAILLLSIRAGTSRRLDALLAATIWLLAVGVWLAVPMQVMQNSFYAPIRPPSGQPFPNSDAGYYDSMAESLLIGHPYQGEIPSRPLYIVFLATLHAIVGERYALIIAAQTLLLALIPVLLFRLGSVLHSRPAGVMAALASIGREWTTLLVSSDTRVSNTRTLLVDLPTLLVLLASCLLTVRWLNRRDNRSGVMAGGMFGLLLLLRTQAAIILPAVLALCLLIFGGRQRAAYKRLAVYLVTIAITIAPWLAHNILIEGQMTIDAPFQYRIIASQYRYTGNLDIESVELGGKSLLGMLTTFAIRDPTFVLGFIANHALATQIGGLLALPLVHEYQGLFGDVNLYWVNWDGTLSQLNVVLLIAYLSIIAIGLGGAWKRMRWAGMVPLAFSLAYSMGNGIARFSGWRYDLPADWTAYFYFALGAAEVLAFLGALFGADKAALLSDAESVDPGSQGPKTLVAGLAMFLLVGFSPWLAKFATPPRYIGATSQALVQELFATPSIRDMGFDGAKLQAAASASGAALEMGRVLYPRFLGREVGLASAHPWPAYAPRSFPRLGFLLLNQSRQDVLLPSREIPQGFEHAADVIVLGCRAGDYIDARLVLFLDTGTVFKGLPLDSPCP